MSIKELVMRNQKNSELTNLIDELPVELLEAVSGGSVTICQVDNSYGTAGTAGSYTDYSDCEEWVTSG